MYEFVFSGRVRNAIFEPRRRGSEVLLPRRRSPLRRVHLRGSPPLTTSLRRGNHAVPTSFGVCIHKRRIDARMRTCCCGDGCVNARRNELFTVARDHLVTAEITASTHDRRFRFINDRKSGLKDRLARVKVIKPWRSGFFERLLVSSLEKFLSLF